MASVACARKLVDGQLQVLQLRVLHPSRASDMASLQNDDLRRVRFIPAWIEKFRFQNIKAPVPVTLGALSALLLSACGGDGSSGSYTAGFADQTDGVFGSITASSATTTTQGVLASGRCGPALHLRGLRVWGRARDDASGNEGRRR